MGQNRTDTSQQIAAKRRTAEVNKCPRCGRKSAVSRTYDPDLGGMVVVCRWVESGRCDYYYDPATPWVDATS